MEEGREGEREREEREIGVQVMKERIVSATT